MALLNPMFLVTWVVTLRKVEPMGGINNNQMYVFYTLGMIEPKPLEQNKKIKSSMQSPPLSLATLN